MKKTFIVIAAVGLTCLLGWQVSQRATQNEKKPERPNRPVSVTVEVSPIRNATIRDVQTFTGTLIPKAQFVVAPKIGGRLKKLLINIGDVIKRNQLIAILDDEEYVQQSEQARAECVVAKAQLEAKKSALAIAKREYERIDALYGKKIASESEFDSGKAELEAKTAEYKVAMAQVSQKEAALKAAQVRLSYTQIRAAWEDGDETRVVGERFVDEGAMLAANSPIVSILDINLLYAVVYAIERDYPKVQVGQEAVIATDAYPGRVFPGRILRKAPVLKMESLQARVEIEIPNPQWLLKPGMFARVQIEFGRHEGATVVPVAALIKRELQQGIFLVDAENLKARFVPVTLGIVNGDSAELLSPAVSGMVVTLGHHLLEDGSSIAISNEKLES